MPKPPNAPRLPKTTTRSSASPGSITANTPTKYAPSAKPATTRGRSRLRQGDKPGALRMFLKVEERPHDRRALLPRAALPPDRRAHRTELNFVTAYRYYRDARDLFMRSESPRQTTEALLGMSVSALRMHDLGRARRDCAMALDLADDLADDTLVRRSLGSLPRSTPSRRTNGSPTTCCCVSNGRSAATPRPQAAARWRRLHLFRQPPRQRPPLPPARRNGSARQRRMAHDRIHGLSRRGPGRELPRSDPQDRRLHPAERFAHTNSPADLRQHGRKRSISANERLSPTTGCRVGGSERGASSRDGAPAARNCRVPRPAADAACTGSATNAICCSSAKPKPNTATWRNLAQRDLAEARLKGIIASRFDIVDRLGKTLYERENTTTGQAAMTREVKRLIDGFAENGEMLQELEQIVDMAHDEVMQKTPTQLPPHEGGRRAAAVKEDLRRLLAPGHQPLHGGASPTSTPASRG